MFDPVRFRYSFAGAMLAGEWTAPALAAVLKSHTEDRPVRVPGLVPRILKAFPTPPAFIQLVAFLYDDRGMSRAAEKMAALPSWRKFRAAPLVMDAPPPRMGALAIPAITNEAALAAWLGVPLRKLLWYADTSGRNRRHPCGPLRTYGHRWVSKGGGRSRLLEIPKPRLKKIQRRILADILNAMPPHDAAHGFRPGRSIVTNAGPHCGKRLVLRFDLADFFPSVSSARVFHTFRTVGYPVAVARLLTGLCTTRLPSDAWDARPNPRPDDHATWQRLASRHLPQGAPTSPALANLAAFRLDRRLAKLAACADAEYTRYADDLTISGGEELARRAKRLTVLVGAIAAEEGFALNHRKTRAMRRGQRQRVAGVVVNAKPNTPRAEFDTLKATLTNCARHGPASQNRGGVPDFRAHLAGRVSHVASVNPVRGRKLWALLDRVKW